MAKKDKYIALVGLGGGVYNVVFPDFDGLVTQGDTYDDAIRNAHEALALHIAGMREDGDAVPEPRDIADIKSDWWGWNDWHNTDYAVALVSVIPASFPRKYTLSMDSGLMARIDRVTNNRSAFIARAVTEYLDSSSVNLPMSRNDIERARNIAGHGGSPNPFRGVGAGGGQKQ